MVGRHLVDSKKIAVRYIGRESAKRVSMGLTDRRKTAKNLVESRKNWKILTVSGKLGKKELTVKEIVP